MGITVIGRRKEEIKYLVNYVKNNVKDIKKLLIIYLIPSGKQQEGAEREIEESIREESESLGDIPYEIKTFTGSPDMAIETFLAKREDIRMLFLFVKKRDIIELLEHDEYASILKKLQKGVFRIPVVFVPYR